MKFSSTFLTDMFLRFHINHDVTSHFAQGSPTASGLHLLFLSLGDHVTVQNGESLTEKIGPKLYY